MLRTIGTVRRWLVALAIVLVGWLAPAVALAGPREDLGNAHIDAAVQLDNIDLEGALATLDAAIVAALDAGLAGDPSLAKMYTMRAGIVWSLTADRAATLESCIEAVKSDYNATPPIELASDELTQICNEARAGIARPTAEVVHTPPTGTPHEDIEFVATANTVMPPGSTLVMYWRPAGSEAEHTGVEMVGDGEGNWGAVTLEVAAHEGKDIEYFFYAFDQNQGTLVHRGDKTNPLILEMDEHTATNATTVDEEPEEAKRPKAKSSLPRVFINLGVGTGLGVAHGTAELTYLQYRPAVPGVSYTSAEQACAAERWYAAGGPLASDVATFQQHLAQMELLGATPYTAGDEAARASFAQAYNPRNCDQRHPVSTGVAVAPLHLSPEIGVRVGRALVLSVYGRLQVLTGSRVFGDDITVDRATSFETNARAVVPRAFRQRPPFTWAIGAKAKYFFGKDDRKLRVFAGGFAGYGQARLRVPMSFANDRNGNSVPDSEETALSGPRQPDGAVAPATCVPVWPYHNGCVDDAEGEATRSVAEDIDLGTPAGEERIDTVVIGPVMLGALLGVNLQLHQNFGLFAEANLGLWLPDTTSALLDLSVGPVLTF